MSIDMQQFHGVFFEESQEHLEEMEQLLMEIDPEIPDAEQLNSIFRAAHSIKGGSGIFGFDALTGLTHVMENLLDRARQGTMALSTSIVDTLLRNVDTLKDILFCYRNEQPIDWAPIEADTLALEAIISPTKKETKSETEQGFGFFSPPVETNDESFGFFDEIEEPSSAEGKAKVAKKVTSKTKVKSKTKPAAKPVSKTKAKPKQKTKKTIITDSQDEDESFGFFEPLVEVKTSGSDKTSKKVSTESIREENPPLIPMKNAEKAQNNKSIALAADKKRVVNTNESATIRVDINKIDSLVNLVGEIVITQSMLSLIGGEIEGTPEDRLHSAIGELERNTRELQETVMSMRMLPMSFVFNRFPRVVRDLSSKLGKQVELVIEGGNTEIDKGLIEKLVDPLTHLVRNSLDHGIEQPEVRHNVGKPQTGTLILRAEQKGGNILISVIDDGGGLNRQKIIDKAREKKIDLPENPTNEQVWKLIMAPGFSTASEVTDVSGRGVGLDVVKRNIEASGGRIEIFSDEGVGSTFQIRLPLTLAILDGMSVGVGDQLFIIPLVNIIESVQPTESQIKLISNRQMLELRDTYWPIVKLHEVMQVQPVFNDPSNAILVLLETSKSRFALLVDDLLGQQQVVIKSLEQHYRRVPGVAGATIMGDGSVALILDTESLAGHADETSMKEKT